MKNILVPIGSSETAVSTLQYAIDLAKEVDAYVYVISVFKELSKVGGLTKVNAIMKEDSENNLDEVVSNVDAKDVTIITHPIKGDIVESVRRFNKHVKIDLMILAPRSTSIKEEVFLGKTTGKLVKQTEIPALIVPKGAIFSKPDRILMAFKNGDFSYKKMLSPLKFFVEQFGSDVHALHVQTPSTTNEMLVVSEKFEKLCSSYEKTENATTFQAVLEHFQRHDPDMLCVVRRPRGFFAKLWEKNEVLKKEFHTSKPLLVLSGE